MKKILVSVSIIAAAAAIVVGATTAFFSDTESSVGNTFTAGSLDLIVDIDGNVENPLDGPIFEVPDMKPGDSGERTISLIVDDNPACGFVSFNLESDLDNTCTEPEAGSPEAGSPGELCTVAIPEVAEGLGELNDNVVWAIWSDMGQYSSQNQDCTNSAVVPGDNKYNPECGDLQLTTGTLVANHSWSIGELATTTNQYYGIKWELPSAVTNIVQSDSFAADMILTAQQKRNQYPDGCPALGLVRLPL